MNFEKVQGCAYLCVSPSSVEGQRFLISSWGSKLQIHPAQLFPSFLLVQRGKLRHSKANWGLQEIASKGAFSFHESTWLSYLCFLYKDGADLRGLLPWGQGISCSQWLPRARCKALWDCLVSELSKSNLAFIILKISTKIQSGLLQAEDRTEPGHVRSQRGHTIATLGPWTGPQPLPPAVKPQSI